MPVRNGVLRSSSLKGIEQRNLKPRLNSLRSNFYANPTIKYHKQVETMKIALSKKMLKMFAEAGELGELITGMESLGINATSIKSYKNKGKKGKKIKKSQQTQPHYR